MDKQYSDATPSAEYTKGVYDALRALEATQSSSLNSDHIASIGDEILANLGIQSHSDEQSKEEDELDA